MMTRSALIGLALAAWSGSASALETHCKGHEANLETVQAMTEILFNQRDERQAERFYAANIVSHNVGSTQAEATVPVSFMQKMWVDSKAAYPERKLTNDLIVCADDIVVVRLTMSGAAKAPPGAPSPIGKRFSTSAIDIYRLKNAKVVEWWGNSDLITMLRQLGTLQALVAADKSAGPAP